MYMMLALMMCMRTSVLFPGGIVGIMSGKLDPEVSQFLGPWVPSGRGLMRTLYAMPYV